MAGIPQRQPTRIAVTDLTDDEIKELEASGRLKKGDTHVGLPGQPVGSDGAPAQAPIPDHLVPVPSEDVIRRAEERIKAAATLEGSSFEIKNEKGEVIKKEGTLPTPKEEVKEDPVDTMDRVNFIAHTLGAQRFKKTYTLFGGRVEVTFQNRTSAEEEACSRQSFYDEDLDGYFGPTGSATRDQMRMTRYLDYQFITSLYSIKFPDGPARIFTIPALKAKDVNDGNTALRQQRLAIMAELSQPMKIAMRTAHNKFEGLVYKLIGEAESPDFWTAVSAS